MTLLALLLTACSSGSEDKADDKGGDKGGDQPSATSSSPGTTTGAGTTTSAASTPMPTINATQVVAAFTGAGYKCTPDVAYVTCTTGGTSIGVLSGQHPRPPVLSLHAAGPEDTSSAEIAKVLPQVLELAHINQGSEITTWFGQQKSQATAQLTVGDWLVEYSAEVDTEEPGTNLTLTDKLCKTNCQAE
ncbi:hypothetical protein AB0L70_20215 [Kribbella sp. NPDC051952]|uniref:hypothetical protein n=1 Tax=Kribbella sp. NPDC051952 TaxID=3154851 RepID=UPI003420D2BD